MSNPSEKLAGIQMELLLRYTCNLVDNEMVMEQLDQLPANFNILKMRVEIAADSLRVISRIKTLVQEDDELKSIETRLIKQHNQATAMLQGTAGYAAGCKLQ